MSCERPGGARPRPPVAHATRQERTSLRPPRARDRRRSDADGQRRARRSEGGNRACQVDERARDSSCTACETARAGGAAGAARQRRRRHAEGHDTSRGMTPILVSKVRSLRATQEASVPCQADLRGASTVGNSTWVAPEEPDRVFFLQPAVASPLPRAWWRLSALLVVGVLGRPPAREGLEGRASVSVVPGVHLGQTEERAGRQPEGQENRGHFWHEPTALGCRSECTSDRPRPGT